MTSTDFIAGVVGAAALFLVGTWPNAKSGSSQGQGSRQRARDALVGASPPGSASSHCWPTCRAAGCGRRAFCWRSMPPRDVDGLSRGHFRRELESEEEPIPVIRHVHNPRGHMLPKGLLAVVYHLTGCAHCFQPRGVQIREIDPFSVGNESPIIDVEVLGRHAACPCSAAELSRAFCLTLCYS